MLATGNPLHTCTDSKSLLGVITKCSNTEKKRLMIDIISVRNAYEIEEISNIEHIRSEHNPDDAVKKRKSCPVLVQVSSEMTSTFHVEQWVYQLNASSRKPKIGRV